MLKASTKMMIRADATSSKKNLLKPSGRKSLKVLQKTATDKENLVGRSGKPARNFYKTKADSENEITELAKRKVLCTQSTQTDAVIHTKLVAKYNEQQEQVIKDLTSEDSPSEGYWEIIAEKRRLALQVTLDENEALQDRIACLEAELKIANQMCSEAEVLVEVLSEMLEGTESEEEARDALRGLNGLMHGANTTLNSTGVSTVFEESNFEDSDEN